jgi:hypothetical protein
MDTVKRQSELIMILYDLMPEHFRLGAHDNEAIMFDYWAGIIGVRHLDKAMNIRDPEHLRKFLIERRNHAQNT